MPNQFDHETMAGNLSTFVKNCFIGILKIVRKVLAFPIATNALIQGASKRSSKAGLIYL